MADKRKVAYFLERFPNLTETFILREMLALRERGLDIQVFSLLPSGQTAIMHRQVQGMMPYVHYSSFIFSRNLIRAQFHFLFRSPIKYFRALWRAIWQTSPLSADLVRMLVIFPKAVYFARQLEEMKVDHIHAHFVWLNAIAAQVAADLIGITYSLHAHAWDIFSRNQECVRRQIGLASAIVTISEYHRQYLSNLCPRWKPEDIHVVHCGLDPAEFTPAHLPSTDPAIHILSVGSMVEKKGHEYLIEACALLAARGYKFRCSIVGPGPLREELQAHIDKFKLQDQVYLLGAKNQAEVQNLFRQSDIFTLACVVSHNGDRDGIPVALMEAMALQLPVVTTPVAGNPELVSDGETGLLVPERDPQALALALERLINDPDLREKLGQQGRQKVLSGFDIHQTVVQMATIFQEIRNSHSA